MEAFAFSVIHASDGTAKIVEIADADASTSFVVVLADLFGTLVALVELLLSVGCAREEYCAHEKQKEGMEGGECVGLVSHDLLCLKIVENYTQMTSKVKSKD